ncbi:MAG: hypothetical protein HDR22_04575 [Lachnospiraceae bacterium]|nr:hypothetical protein [Lachnospiraceae bacterium]
MSKNNVDILMQDIEIPDIVQKKAQDAFTKIRWEAREEEDNMNQEKAGKKNKHFWQTRAAAAALAVILGGGSLTALAATYIHLSGGMQSHMNISDEQTAELQNTDDSLLSFPAVSDTQDGITVSVAQCLVDESNIRLAFYVDGYELENSVEPELEYLNILLDGQPANNYDWYFYSGIDWTDNKEPVMADGSPVLENAEGEIIPNYRIADGKMEIDLNMSPVDENGKSISALNGRVITVFLQNFGEHTGTWTLEWTLGGTDTSVEAKLNEALGNSGATVTVVKVSPISIDIYYDFAKREIVDTDVDENGNTIEYTDFSEPPRFVGVKMKDGTVYTGMFDGGTCGYESADTSIYIAQINLSRVINPENVQSLLFLKEDSAVTGEHEITEKECYIVDLY